MYIVFVPKIVFREKPTSIYNVSRSIRASMLN